jgi:hypothetical protein
MRTRKASCALEWLVSLEERGRQRGGGGFSGVPIETEEGKGRGTGGRRATVGENGVGARPTRFRGRGA